MWDLNMDDEDLIILVENTTVVHEYHNMVKKKINMNTWWVGRTVGGYLLFGVMTLL